MHPRTTIAHRRFLAGSLLALLVPAPSPLHAADLTWEQVRARVPDQPEVRAAEAESRAAVFGVRGTLTPGNPEVEVGFGSGVHLEDGARLPIWEASVSLPFTGLRDLLPRLAAARGREAAAEASRDLAIREAEVALWTLFVEGLFDAAVTASLGETEAQVTALADLVKIRVDTGEARPIEALRVTTELERARLDTADAGARTRLHREALARRLDLPADDLRLSGDLLTSGTLPDPGAVAASLDTHPLVRAAVATADTAQAEARAEARQWVPVPAVGAFAASELDGTLQGITLSAEIPLWNWNVAEARAARARSVASDALAEQVRRDVSDALAAARTSCEQALASATRHRDVLLPAAERAAADLETTFRVGEVGLTDVIDALRVVGAVRREHLAGWRDARIACGTLAIWMGETP